MTTNQNPITRRRLAATAVAAAIGLASLGATLGFLTSPGPVRSTAGAPTELAIPGVRGTGGGAGAVYGVSTSPGRKAGGGDPLEY